MLRRFSIFTKGIACVLVVAMCTVFVPSTVQASGSDPCQSLKDKAWAETKNAVRVCAGTTLGCAAAILAGTYLGIAGCAYFFFTHCQPAQVRAADAWAAYWNCNYNSNQAN